MMTAPSIPENAKPYISTGNTKTGFPSFNLLAGPSDRAYTGMIPAAGMEQLKQCPGTCGCHNCYGCYAKKMTRYAAVFNHYAINTLFTLTEPGRAAIYDTISAFIKLYEPRYFRIHDSGDFNSFEYFEMWARIAEENPDTTFYCYTKQIQFVSQYKAIHGCNPHITIQLSTWPGVCEISDIAAAGLIDFPRFEYDDHTRPELEKIPHCPAVDKNGKRTGITCAQCKHCARSKAGQVWAVYAH